MIEYIQKEIKDKEKKYKAVSNISPVIGGAYQRGYYQGQIKALSKILLRLNEQKYLNISKTNKER